MLEFPITATNGGGRVSSFREPMNGLLHFGALMTSLVATGFLLGQTVRYPDKLLTLGIYGLCMSLTFLASSAHHLVHADRRTEEWLLKLDHAAIFLYIAGSYTPITVTLLPDPVRWQFLTVVWLIAAAGVAYKLVVFKAPADLSDPPDRLSVAVFVIMGWLIVWQFPALMAQLNEGALRLGLLGGAFYTLGGVILTSKAFDFWPGLLGHHEIWHVCVIGGSVCIYLLIYWHVLPVRAALLAIGLA
jgi:hemolysin III